MGHRMAETTVYCILVVTWIPIMIQEFFTGFLIYHCSSCRQRIIKHNSVCAFSLLIDLGLRRCGRWLSVFRQFDSCCFRS